MPLTFPVPTADFADELRVASVQWNLSDIYVQSGTRGGKILRAETADPAWTGTLSLAPMSIEDARQVRAKIRRIGAYNKFNLYNPEAPFPRYDPTGSVLGNATVTVSAIGPRSLRLQGLPSGYRLAWGDFVSVVRGGNRALFEVAEYVEASGSGVTPFFDVTPPPKVWMQTGDVADLKKPAARVLFDQIDTGTSAEWIASGISFSVIEAP